MSLRNMRKKGSLHREDWNLTVLSAILLIFIVSVIWYGIIPHSKSNTTIKAAFFENAVKTVYIKNTFLDHNIIAPSGAISQQAGLPGMPSAYLALALVLALVMLGRNDLGAMCVIPLISGTIDSERKRKEDSGLFGEDRKQINQILLLALNKHVIEPLREIVRWDRYGFREDNGFLFGWIDRDDERYDFVVVRFWIEWKEGAAFYCSYDTSSKKYSREIGRRLGSSLVNYLECRPAGEILPDDYLVWWQKQQKK